MRFELDVCYVVVLAFVYFVVICLLVVGFAVTGLVGFGVIVWICFATWLLGSRAIWFLFGCDCCFAI